jgi:mono/diheme cytochrome c family protein
VTAGVKKVLAGEAAFERDSVCFEEPEYRWPLLASLMWIAARSNGELSVVAEETVNRGQERFNIFCSVCHGKTGHGDGMVVRRGFRRAASFHDDRLRAAPVGHFFDAITNGWGAMPSYAAQIPVQDRWAIIAYIRALQASQNIKTEVPPSASPTPTPVAGGHK